MASRFRRQSPADPARPALACEGCAGCRRLLELLLTVALVLCACRGAMAADFKGTVETGVGHDTNVFRESSTVDSNLFFLYSLDLFWKARLDPASALRLGGAAVGRLYPDPTRDGRIGEFGVELDYDRRLLGGRAGIVRSPSLDIELRASADRRDRVYYSRGRGEEVTVVSGGETVSLGNRYDASSFTARLGLTLRWPRRTRWIVRGTNFRRDYLDDYRDVPEIDSLDYRTRRLRLGFRQDIVRGLHIGLEYLLSRTEYDEWSSRDFDGNRVFRVPQEFHYSKLSGSIEVDHAKRHRLALRVVHRQREDPFQGYYTYGEWAIVPELGWMGSRGLRVDLRYEWSHREYERARVGFNPVRPLRRDTFTEFNGKAAYSFTPRDVVSFAIAGEVNDEANPNFTYRRTRMWFGYRREL